MYTFSESSPEDQFKNPHFKTMALGLLKILT